MKVVHFITTLDTGGAQTILCDLLEHWEHTGVNKAIEHHVIYIHKMDHHKQVLDRIKKLHIPVYHLKGGICKYDPISFYRLAKLVKKIKPDIIHSSLWAANFMSRFISKFYKIPLVCDLHNAYELNGKIRNFLDSATNSIPNVFVAVAGSVKNSFACKYGTSFLNKAIVIQNGIDSERIRTKARQNSLNRQKLGLGEMDFVIGAVGRLDKVKRYDLLIKAFAKFRTSLVKMHLVKAHLVKAHLVKAHLVIVGDGNRRIFLEDLARSLGVYKDVYFVGERDNVHSYYPLFDCFAISSQTEGLSMALLEALSFGLPIVTTCSENRHEVVTDGINGFLVPVNDIDSLACSFEKLCFDDGLRARIGEANIELVGEKFHISNVAAGYFGIYKSLSC